MVSTFAGEKQIAMKMPIVNMSKNQENTSASAKNGMRVMDGQLAIQVSDQTKYVICH